MAQPFYFLHISKTAGSSMRRVIEAQRSLGEPSPISSMDMLAEAVRTSPASLRKHRLFIGHLGYTLVQYLPEPPVIVTMLRDPVTRTISTFNYMRRHEQHWMHARFKDRELTLDAWLEDEAARHLITSFQVRNIALEFDLADDLLDKHGKVVTPNQGRLLAYVATEGAQDPALLDVAKQRIEQFAFVGLTERFEDSIRLLLDRFGWTTRLTVPRVNRAPRGVPSSETISAGALAIIRELTQLDQKLYDYANSLLDQRLERHAPGPLTSPGLIRRLLDRFRSG